MTRNSALTSAQRLRFEMEGYVVLPDVLGPAEVDTLKAVLYRMREDPARAEKGIYTITKDRSYYVRMGNLIEYDPAIVAFASHARIVAAAEQLVGGSVKLEENETIINRRNPEADLTESTWPNATCFHRALDPSWGCYLEGGRLHCLFVKAIAYLTDVGPLDGGTCLIPGSHRSTWPREDILRAAEEDPSLYRCVEAPAGSVLLFAESALHSTTAVLSDRERVILTSGYTAPMFRMERGNRIRRDFVATLPRSIRPVISGSQRWRWKRPLG
jgi:ectoine hydroxylase-related dioxygenase (phytanoyl-CoA dioxygenase family)